MTFHDVTWPRATLSVLTEDEVIIVLDGGPSKDLGNGPAKKKGRGGRKQEDKSHSKHSRSSINCGESSDDTLAGQADHLRHGEFRSLSNQMTLA